MPQRQEMDDSLLLLIGPSLRRQTRRPFGTMQFVCLLALLAVGDSALGDFFVCVLQVRYKHCLKTLPMARSDRT